MNKKIMAVCFTAATIAIMVAIFLFSSQNSDDSSDLSKGFIERVISYLPFLGHITAEQKEAIIRNIHNFVRKTAHFSIYAALGFSSAGVFGHYLPDMKKRYVYICAVILCCMYAGTDEWHQLFSAGRSGEVRDVCIDTGGGAVGAMIYMLVWELVNRWRKRKLKA